MRAEARNVADHIGALSTFSRHDVRTFDPVDRPDAAALLDPDEFDVVVVHYTIPIVDERYLPGVLAERIARFDGLKVQFIQDEYRWIDALTTRMRELGIRLLFTCVPERELPNVYGARAPNLETVPTLPGYVPDDLAAVVATPLRGRPIDVGYRGRTVPYWLGRLGQEKAEIGHGFLARAAEYGLRCDISSAEEDRLYGDAWNRFLLSSRATLGTESGASIVDYDGSVEAQVRAYLIRHPGAPYEEVEREVLAPYEGNVVVNAVSPRVFEAAALRTAMVMFPGEYSDVVEPWRHYVPLEKDYSNMDEVAARLRDDRFLTELTERAHADLVASGRYSLRAFTEQFDELLAARSTSESPVEKTAYVRASAIRRSVVRSAIARARPVVGKPVQPLAMATLVARDRPVRGLAWAAPSVVRVRPGGLARDLWRLAALRRAVAAGLVHTVARVELEGRRIVLTSRPGPKPEGGSSFIAQASDALERGRLEQLIWDHGVTEAIPLLGEGLLLTRIGHHGVGGAHGFSALVEVARRNPRAVRDALGPLLVDASDGT
jgi:hypothetical protein